MEITPITESDLPLLKEINPPDWDDITPSVAGYISSERCYPLKWMSSGKLMGMGATIVHGRTGWLGHIIVHPGARNRGLGREITATLMDRLKAENVETQLLFATPLGKAVYSKLGFQPESEYIFFKDGTVEDAISKAIVPMEERHHADVFRMDRMVSGEDRKYLLEQHLEGGRVFEEDGSMQGYYIPKMGDGLVHALNAHAGIALLNEKLRDKPKVVVPETNPAAIEWLERRGFKEVRRGTRMWLGKQVPFRGEMQFSRVSGSLG